MTTVRAAVSMPRTVVTPTSPAPSRSVAAPRPSPDSFVAGNSSELLRAKLRRAEDLMAFRLGALRATIFTAPAQGLSDAALAAKDSELVRAGKALKKSNEQQLAAMHQREQLEHRLVQHPTDARLVHQLDAAREREVALVREVRSGSRDVQRLLSGLDVDTLAKLESPLRGFVVPEKSSVAHALAEVKTLRTELARR